MYDCNIAAHGLKRLDFGLSQLAKIFERYISASSPDPINEKWVQWTSVTRTPGVRWFCSSSSVTLWDARRFASTHGR